MRTGNRTLTLRPPLGWLCALALLAMALPGCAQSRDRAKEGDEKPPDVSIDNVEEEHLTAPVAVVNGVEIYRSSYEQILEFLRSQVETGGATNVERYLKARDDALERAIDMELLYQEAVRRGFRLSDDELREEYAKRVSHSDSEEAYLASARTLYFTKSEVLDGIRKELSVNHLIDKEIESHLTATEVELREYYALNQSPFTTEETARLGSIFVSAPQEATVAERASALTRITKALDRVRKGESFERVAQEVSEDGVAQLGGMLGTIKRGYLPPKLDKAAFALNPGEVSNVVESEDGYHVLKLYKRSGGELKPFEEVEDEVRRRVIERKKNEGIRDLVATLRESAEINRQLG